MAAVGCLEKEIQFQKEAIKEQGMRQAKDRLPTKNFYIRLKTLFFHQKHPAKGPPYACCPLLPASAMRIAAPPGLISPSDGSPFRGYGTRPGHCPCAPARFGRRCADMAASDMTSSKPGTENSAALPFPDHETKSLPAHRRRGPAIRTRAKVLQGEGDRGRGTLFQKCPPPPENTRPPPSKTMLQLPRPPPRRHLPKQARQGERLPQRDQASATARAGGP